jgi:GT2 family glycosyltransferase
VSVIIPTLGEEMLAAALDSVRSQDYDGAVEIVVADASEGRQTTVLVEQRFPEVRVVPNPEGSISSGLNRALAASTHPVVARCDARTTLPSGYLAAAVRTLRRTGAAAVGGRQQPRGATRFERAVGLAMTSPLGAGDARYRIGGGEGPVDTVYLGVFRRDALDAVGGFDETIPRNEDYDLNWRLHERGETVWFDPGLAVDYRPRGSLRALARQYFDYGRWKRVMLKRHPRSWRLRHVAAPLLLAALAASAWLGVAGVLVSAVTPETGVMLIYAAAAGPLAYVLLLLAASAALGLRRRRPEAVLLPVVAATIHLAWAAGFFAGALADAGERWR